MQDRFAVVGHRDRSSALQHDVVGQSLAKAADRRCRDWKYVNACAAFGVLHPSGNRGQVIDRVGIGHGADGSKAPRGSRGRARSNGLFSRLARLAQMNVNINESRCYDQPARIQRVVSFAAKLARRRNLSDTTIHEQHIIFAVELLGGINEMAFADGQAIF